MRRAAVRRVLRVRNTLPTAVTSPPAAAPSRAVTIVGMSTPPRMPAQVLAREDDVVLMLRGTQQGSQAPCSLDNGGKSLADSHRPLSCTLSTRPGHRMALGEARVHPRSDARLGRPMTSVALSRLFAP